MKPNKREFAAVTLRSIVTFLSVVLLVLLSVPYSAAGKVVGWQAGQTVTTAHEKKVTTAHEKKVIATFNRRVKDYLKQRERVKAKVPSLSKDATPEQIAAYQKSFVEALRAMRAGTKPGYIFNRQTADYLRTTIKTEFPPREKAEIRETILEADTKGVPLKVNYPYPETKELTQIPPTLLLKLPELPKEVKYRYVGRHLLLVDTDNNLIVDYMLDALP
jgi:ABC-type transporter MlaC component